MPDNRVLEITLNTGAKEFAPIMIRWPCNCTDNIRWVTGLKVIHNTEVHVTDFQLSRIRITRKGRIIDARTKNA